MTLLGLGVSVLIMAEVKEKIILLNEGLWQSDNGKITYFEDGEILSNEWFRDNNGTKLGDTPSDIIQVNKDLIAIAVNWSNIIQFITPDGNAVAAIENIPNNRKLATDGRYVYVTSYGHEVEVNGHNMNFEKGYVAKVDTKNFNVVSAVEVGYEPEGIALYDGHLFVANTGGYAFQEGHEYESTVSVVDAENMIVTRVVDTGQINLYSKLSQSGKYLCINSAGDYYSVEPSTIIFDCEATIAGKEDDDCFVALDCVATANCKNAEGGFFAIGSSYSYTTGQYEFNYSVIDPEEVFVSKGARGVTSDFPGNVKEYISAMSMPYSIYVNPYTGYIYATDAGEYTGMGAMYQWSADGEFLGKHSTYINPAHFLALEPDNYKGPDTSGVEIPEFVKKEDNAIYNLQGMKVMNIKKGQVYICNGKKIIF